MNDLISRSELLESFKKSYCGHLGMENSDGMMTFRSICRIIKEQPTAYSVDKVVEELKEKENKQLAEWLEELKDYRRFKGAKTFDNGFKNGERYGYTKAIDDFAERLHHKITSEIDDCADELDWIDKIAEQLKEGSADDG